jgi:hypothetical protein
LSNVNIEDLKKQLLEDQTVQNNVAAANQLANSNEPEKAIKILVEGFEIAHPNVRVAVINSLVKLGAKEAIPQIANSLKSFNAAERNAAVEALVHENIRKPEVVSIFKTRLHFERDATAKSLVLQKLAELPYAETVDLLLEILKDESYRATPFIENIRNSLTLVGPRYSSKLIQELGSPIGDEIVNILKSVDLSSYPDVWESLSQSLNIEEQEIYKKIQSIIVSQIEREYSNELISGLMNNVISEDIPGLVKERSISIVDLISKTSQGPKLVKPALDLLKAQKEGEVKRKGFIDTLPDIKSFDVAKLYFDEAKNCFVRGFFRPSIILAMSSLESCVKQDYIENSAENREKGEEFVNKTSFHKLLNKYFNVNDIGRLPKQYEDFSNTHVKIRNSLVHPEEFEFSEKTAEFNLRLISELIMHIESKQIGEIPEE